MIFVINQFLFIASYYIFDYMGLTKYNPCIHNSLQVGHIRLVGFTCISTIHNEVYDIFISYVYTYEEIFTPIAS